MKKIWLFSWLLLAGGLSACNFSLAADVTPPPGYKPALEAQSQESATPGPFYPLVPPDPARGEAIYVEACAACHGFTGLGDGPRAIELPNPIPAIGDPEAARQASPASWFKTITEGHLERLMPAFLRLTNRQRWDVVAYLYRLSAPAQRLEQGASLYQDNCEKCHGRRGKGNGALAPEKTTDFTDQESMASKTAAQFFLTISQGVKPVMPTFTTQLSEDERWALTDYLRSLSFARPAVAEGSLATPIPDQTPAVTETAALAKALATLEAQGLGLVKGLATNASGGAIPEGSQVMLYAFDQMQLAYTATTRLQVDGSYTFDAVEVVKGLAFLSTIEFEGVTYGSELSLVEKDGELIELPIQVYDSTSDTSGLSVDRLHYFFEFLDLETVRVAELYVISNATNQTVVARSPEEPVLSFSLPPGASNLQFQEGELGGRYIKTEQGFGDSLPIHPGVGAYQLLFSYQMPYQRKLELTRPVALDTHAIVILAPDNSVKVKGEGIEDGGMRDVQGVQYRMYNGGSLKPGSEVRLTVTGHPVGGQTDFQADTGVSLLVGMGGLGFALVLAGAWMYSRSRASQEKELPVGAQNDLADESVEGLMDAILALDDLFKDGRLPEEAYIDRRVDLKARLKAKME